MNNHSAGLFSRAQNQLSLELFAAIFGLSQIVWFLWLTGCLYRLKNVHDAD